MCKNRPFNHEAIQIDAWANKFEETLALISLPQLATREWIERSGNPNSLVTYNKLAQSLFIANSIPLKILVGNFRENVNFQIANPHRY